MSDIPPQYIRAYSPPRPHPNGAASATLRIPRRTPQAKPRPLTWRERAAMLVLVFGIPTAIFLTLALCVAGVFLLFELLAEIIRHWRP